MADHLDPSSNALNLVRLVLASSVIFWHSFPITGHPLAATGPAQLLGDLGVDGFFAISGFLLAGSWLYRPHLLTYARNRALRILPAFWVCLLATAFVLAPLASLVQGRSVSALFHGAHSSPLYVVHNLALKISFYDVSGTPLGVPYPHVWNGSAWTLIWETYAYIGLAVLGVAGLLRRRWVVVAVAIALWAVSLAQNYDWMHHDYNLTVGSRLGFMFVCGVLLRLFHESIPARRWLFVLCCALILAASYLSDYRLLAGPAVAYAVMWVGGAVRNQSLQLRDRDVSYGIYIYGFPVQQMLAVLGATALTPVLFGVVSLAVTAPVAVASWVAVERPALHLKSRARVRATA